MWPDGRFGDEQCESDLNIRGDAAVASSEWGTIASGYCAVKATRWPARQIETLLLRYAAFSE
jgi:hypothetical protein